MPRVTRAALRSMEDTDLAASIQLPLTPRKERPPLGEIAGNGNVLESSGTNSLSIGPTKAQKKVAAKARKGRGAKKVKPADDVHNGDHVEVLEDDNQSATSSAVDEACEELLKDEDSSKLLQVLPEQDVNDAPLPHTIVVKQVIDLQGSATHHDATTPTKLKTVEDEDSFVDTIKSRTPAKITTTGIEAVKSSKGVESIASRAAQKKRTSSEVKRASKEDSFVDKIVQRSPAKMVTRIEDSVEAIDAFEDEIEKVGELIPTISKGGSPAKIKKAKNSGKDAATKSKNAGVMKTVKGKAEAKIAKSKPALVSQGIQPQGIHSDRSSANNSEEGTTKMFGNGAPKGPAKRISSIHKAPFLPAKSTKPPTRSNFELPGDAISRKLKERREERLKDEAGGEDKKETVKPTPKPVKSAKPLTRSNFNLPGEAVARKLKEQREDRLKQREGDALIGKKEFKARPIRLSQAPAVKGTATSKARMSLAKAVGTANKDSHDGAPTIRPASKRPLSITPGDASTTSALSVVKRTSQPAANTSARITRGPSIARASSSRLSTAASAHRTTSDGKTAHQTLRGREVFERSKVVKEDQERIRKEKEEAAKKARAEAAERGRIASRLWAEKQKSRKASTENQPGQKGAAMAT